MNDIEKLAQENGIKVWKVYYIINKLKLDRLPSNEEIRQYIDKPKKKGRPKKYNRQGE